MVMELVALAPGAATTSMRPSLGPVTGCGWVVAVVAVAAVVWCRRRVVVAVDDDRRLTATAWPSWSWWSWWCWCWSWWSRAASWPGPPRPRRWRLPAAELAATVDWVAASWLCSALVWAAWAARASLLAFTAVECTAGLSTKNHSRASGGRDQGRGIDPFGQDGLLGEGAVEDEGLLVLRGDLDLVGLLLLRALPEPLPGLDSDPDEAGLARRGRQPAGPDLELEGVGGVEGGDLDRQRDVAAAVDGQLLAAGDPAGRDPGAPVRPRRR